jgi:hypothetical protein
MAVLIGLFFLMAAYIFYLFWRNKHPRKRDVSAVLCEFAKSLFVCDSLSFAMCCSQRSFQNGLKLLLSSFGISLLKYWKLSRLDLMCKIWNNTIVKSSNLHHRFEFEVYQRGLTRDR